MGETKRCTGEATYRPVAWERPPAEDGRTWTKGIELADEYVTCPEIPPPATVPEGYPAVPDSPWYETTPSKPRYISWHESTDRHAPSFPAMDVAGYEPIAVLSTPPPRLAVPPPSPATRAEAIAMDWRALLATLVLVLVGTLGIAGLILVRPAVFTVLGGIGAAVLVMVGSAVSVEYLMRRVQR